jgi:hypothetical protein
MGTRSACVPFARSGSSSNSTSCPSVSSACASTDQRFQAEEKLACFPVRRNTPLGGTIGRNELGYLAGGHRLVPLGPYRMKVCAFRVATRRHLRHGTLSPQLIVRKGQVLMNLFLSVVARRSGKPNNGKTTTKRVLPKGGQTERNRGVSLGKPADLTALSSRPTLLTIAAVEVNG